MLNLTRLEYYYYLIVYLINKLVKLSNLYFTNKWNLNLYLIIIKSTLSYNSIQHQRFNHGLFEF